MSIRLRLKDVVLKRSSGEFAGSPVLSFFNCRHPKGVSKAYLANEGMKVPEGERIDVIGDIQFYESPLGLGKIFKIIALDGQES